MLAQALGDLGSRELPLLAAQGNLDSPFISLDSSFQSTLSAPGDHKGFLARK